MGLSQVIPSHDALRWWEVFYPERFLVADDRGIQIHQHIKSDDQNHKRIV